jgi:NTP pyrophosphatase (non-canonical NTP hydrolase)
VNINNWIEESHHIAQDKGFYDCDRCKGRGHFPANEDTAGSNIICTKCNGTGKKDKDISELISLTIGELYEAQEAHRKGEFAKKETVDFYVEKLCKDLQPETPISIGFFELSIKDKFEDECADVLIRLFDTMGHLEIEYNKDYAGMLSITMEETFFKNILMLNDMLIWIGNKTYSEAEFTVNTVTEFIQYFLYFCQQQNVDIETHINLKMEYNRTREYKHGKNY